MTKILLLSHPPLLIEIENCESTWLKRRLVIQPTEFVVFVDKHFNHLFKVTYESCDYISSNNYMGRIPNNEPARSQNFSRQIYPTNLETH